MCTQNQLIARAQMFIMTWELRKAKIPRVKTTEKNKGKKQNWPSHSVVVSS